MMALILNPRTKSVEPLDYFMRVTFPTLVDEELEALSEEESDTVYRYGGDRRKEA